MLLDQSLRELILTEFSRAEKEDDGHGDGYSDGGHTEHFGVHITYEDLYAGMIFIATIWVAGKLASYVFRMPSLVGEIIVGILLGPPIADYVPYPYGWVLFGEMGLVLLVLEAGIDIDVSTLKLIGSRGVIIAVVGSLLPIGIAVGLAYGIGVSGIKEALAAGATFGPTSVGIALNVLRSGGVLNTPVGQLVVSAAVIDDMIALVILSQLEILVDEITAIGVLIPLISAICFLVGGGVIALFVFPPLIFGKFEPRFVPEEYKGSFEIVFMFAILLGMMPATYYGKASYLMGSFITGLCFCTSEELHHEFVHQFKRVMQWLIRIFFAASIGFQVPLKDFADGDVIWKGLVFCIAWAIGKIVVGFFAPNFGTERNFTGNHLRDCLIVGLSMAAEGEFAFVIAVFSVDNGLIDKDLYASLILAVLISTIIPPFLLRALIVHSNKKAKKKLEELVDEFGDSELDERRERDKEIIGDMKKKQAMFWCIQTETKVRWGLLKELMVALSSCGLDVIDHRVWNERGLSTILNTEVYARDLNHVNDDGVESRCDEIYSAIEMAVNDEEGRITVTRWNPGAFEKIDWGDEIEMDDLEIGDQIMEEAQSRLADRGQKPSTSGSGAPKDDDLDLDTPRRPIPAGRRTSLERGRPSIDRGGRAGYPQRTSMDRARPSIDMRRPREGRPAEIIVDGVTYNARLTDQVINSLRGGTSDKLDSRGVEVPGIQGGIIPENKVSSRLQGYIRNRPAPNDYLHERMSDDDRNQERGSVDFVRASIDRVRRR